MAFKVRILSSFLCEYPVYVMYVSVDSVKKSFMFLSGWFKDLSCSNSGFGFKFVRFRGLSGYVVLDNDWFKY